MSAAFEIDLSHADETQRCKHFCCREGLDKPPKAPKTSFIPASTLVDGSDLLQSRPATQSKLSIPMGTKSAQNGCSSAIEKVDLVGKDQPSGPPKKTPRQMQVLDKLHQSVNKRATVPTVTQKKPSIDFSSDDQSRLSFLRDDDRINPPQRDSTDYGDNSTTEFPSPTELLNQCNPTIVQTVNADRKDAFDTNSLEDFDLSQFDNDEWDTDAALVGLSDSVTMQEESKSAQRLLDSPMISDEPSSVPEMPAVSTRTGNNDKNPTRIPDKRPAEFSEKSHESQNVDQNSNVPKRQKLDRNEKANDQTVLSGQHHPSTIPGIGQPSPTLPAPPVIEKGHPAWVYELDPAFIAEYQDIVEFV